MLCFHGLVTFCVGYGSSKSGHRGLFNIQQLHDNIHLNESTAVKVLHVYQWKVIIFDTETKMGIMAKPNC